MKWHKYRDEKENMTVWVLVGHENVGVWQYDGGTIYRTECAGDWPTLKEAKVAVLRWWNS